MHQTIFIWIKNQSPVKSQDLRDTRLKRTEWFLSHQLISLKICFLVTPQMWLNRAEKNTPHLHVRGILQGQPLGLQLWDTHKDCREGCWRYRTGLLGLGQEWGKAETTTEQFS